MKKKKRWQKDYIKLLLSKYSSDSDISDLLLNNLNLVNDNTKYLPNTLYRFYPVTADNLLDVRDKKLWLSHPSTFNDPFDCSIGYNEKEFEKKQLIKAYNRNEKNEINEIVTADEIEQIIHSCVNGEEEFIYSRKQSYNDTMYKIERGKTNDQRNKLSSYRLALSKDGQDKISSIRDSNIRIACFIAENEYGMYETNTKNHDCLSKAQMWSHYANNHKGFCVEYDISDLKKELKLNCETSDFYSDDKKNEYLSERLSIITKGSLLPVIYTSQRVNIPYTKLSKFNYIKSAEIVELLYKSFITKSTYWSYENEWRLIIDRKVSEYYNNKIPFPFIKKIYLGGRMEKEHVDKLLEIGELLNVEVEFMKMENHKFDLQNHSSWLYKYYKSMNTFGTPYKR